MENLLLFLSATLLCMNSASPHGIDGRLYRAEEERESSRSQPDELASASGKSFAQPATTESARWWGAGLSTGWTSREMHYGVDETGDYGAYTTELSLHIQNLTLSAWAGFGTGNDYQEWDFTVAYNFQFGLKAIWKINRFISLFGAINYSVAMTALREIDQGNEVWASAGVTFTY